MQKITNNSGIYILEIYLSSPFIITGKFNNYSFGKGYYYYTGSAQKNLSSRLERHYKKDKKLHWHIDYITSQENCSITGNWVFSDLTKEFECILNNKLINLNKLSVPVKGFGSSDCSHCDSHLLFAKHRLGKSIITLFHPVASLTGALPVRYRRATPPY